MTEWNFNGQTILLHDNVHGMVEVTIADNRDSHHSIHHATHVENDKYRFSENVTERVRKGTRVTSVSFRFRFRLQDTPAAVDIQVCERCLCALPIYRPRPVYSSTLTKVRRRLRLRSSRLSLFRADCSLPLLWAAARCNCSFDRRYCARVWLVRLSRA